MFGIGELRRELRDLKDENKRLSDRVLQLEIDAAPYRVGKQLAYPYCWYPGWTDPRTRVGLRTVVDHIMAHLKIQLTATTAVPERVEVEKIK